MILRGIVITYAISFLWALAFFISVGRKTDHVETGAGDWMLIGELLERTDARCTRTNHKQQLEHNHQHYQYEHHQYELEHQHHHNDHHSRTHPATGKPHHRCRRMRAR